MLCSSSMSLETNKPSLKSWPPFPYLCLKWMLFPPRSSSKYGDRGQDDMVQGNLSNPRRDLAIICRRLILLACMANNTFHLWLTTSSKNMNIITTESLKHMVSKKSFCLSKTIPLQFMSTCLSLLAEIASKSYNITSSNTNSHPSLSHSKTSRTNSLLILGPCPWQPSLH